MIAILAGSYKQFKDYLHHNELNEKDYVYIDRAEKIRGLYFNGYKIIGTFWEDVKNPNELLYELEFRLTPPTKP